MTDKPKDESNKKGDEPPELEPRLNGDFIEVAVRDGVNIVIKMDTPTQALVLIGSDKAVMAPDTGHFFSSTFRKRLAESAVATFGKDAPHIREDIERVASKLGAPTAGGQTLLDELQAAAKRSVMDRLVIYARASAEFFHNSEMEGFASVNVGEHRENYELEEPRFQLWLRHEFWEREKVRIEEEELRKAGGLFEANTIGPIMPTVVRDRDLGDATRQLESIAIFEGAREEVHIRTAWHEGSVYIDLGDEEWRAIEIVPGSWRFVEGDDIPVKFVRPKGLLPFVDPVESGKGSLEPLTELVNFGEGEEGESNRVLALAWLSQAFLPTGPFPVLTLSGPQGAAKSHAVKILRNLVDPSSAPSSTKPKSEHDAYIDAAANQVLAYDNMPQCPVWLSNVLCDIATGGGFRTRKLYTNRQQEIFQDTRPIILAGIGNIATRPDLLDRAVMLHLPRIDAKKRKLERVIKRELPTAQPYILSAVLDAVAEGLAKVEGVKLEELPRMADFAVWGIATEVALGGKIGAFMKAYEGSRQDATGVAFEAWALADSFIAFASRYAKDNPFEGTPTELWTQLARFVDDDVKHSDAWPKSPAALTNQVNPLVSDLLEVGIVVERDRSSKTRANRVYKVDK